MASPPNLRWDISYRAKSPSAHVPEWKPTGTRINWFKFLRLEKQKADAILDAARLLNKEIQRPCLIQETDNIGREGKLHLMVNGGFKGFRLMAIKLDGHWEATIWPSLDDEFQWAGSQIADGRTLEELLGGEVHYDFKGKVAKGRTLEECLKELQAMIRNWTVRTRRRGDGDVENTLLGNFG